MRWLQPLFSFCVQYVSKKRTVGSDCNTRFRDVQCGFGPLLGMEQHMARTSRPTPQPFRDGWRIRWTDARGKRRSEVYANERDAKFKLDSHLLEAQQVKRGLRGLAIPDKTFNALADHWLKTRAKRKRSEKDDISIIKSRLRPFFGTYKLREITLDVVDEFIAAWIEENSEKTVNTTSRCSSLCSTTRRSADGSSTYPASGSSK